MNMNSPMDEVYRQWLYEALQVPNMLGDDSESAARAAARLYEKTGIRVDYLTLEGVHRSTATLGLAELSALGHAARDCGAEESAFQIAVYVQRNPPFRVVAMPDEA